MPNVFSVDVEDWFHVLESDRAPRREQWGSMPSRVRHGTETLLDRLAAHDVRATFFVLGWVADRHPGLIADIRAAGHEIASHGYRHDLVHEQSPEEFRDDLRRANDAIERACGVVPKGYRAPGFSITDATPWAFDVLAEEGFVYDSSVFPAARAHGGQPGAHPLPTVLANGLVEFPVSTVKLRAARYSYLGGGYLRALPAQLVLATAEAQARAGVPLILYVHPRDIDPDQPRLKLGPARYLRTYIGLGRCLDKVSTLLERFDWTSFEDYVEFHRPAPGAASAAAD